MKEFQRLTEIMEALLGPQGCPWDKKQTFESLRKHILEEASELIEAINLEDNEKILEETGDLFFNAIFLCKVAENQARFSTKEVLNEICEKLVRRHPHVFGGKKLQSSEEVAIQWEEIKKTEKTKRLSILDSIPKEAPALFRAQRMLEKCNQKKCDQAGHPISMTPSSDPQEDIINAVLELSQKANELGVDLEIALRKRLAQEEREFREWEQQKP